ncbi:MAG: hypothetical protein LUF85_04270 [Bacteroides sp.]|nr:hypothetical protein [Bacteroides sp.]
MKYSGRCKINTKDLWDAFGGILQRGAYEELLTPTRLKSFIENKSRLEHGTQVLIKDPKLEERTITLSIMIHGKDEEEYLKNYQAFLQELYKGEIVMEIPKLKQTFYLLFDSCSKYGNYGKKAGKFQLKLREPNPDRRE